MNREEAEEYTRALAQVHEGGWRLVYSGVKAGVPEALGLSVRAWVERLGGYIRVSIEDRREAVKELMAEPGMTQRKVAAVLGVDPMTVNHDLRPVENSTRRDTEQTPDGRRCVENSTPIFPVAPSESKQLLWQDTPAVKEMLDRVRAFREEVKGIREEYERMERIEKFSPEANRFFAGKLAEVAKELTKMVRYVDRG